MHCAISFLEFAPRWSLFLVTPRSYELMQESSEYYNNKQKNAAAHSPKATKDMASLNHFQSKSNLSFPQRKQNTKDSHLCQTTNKHKGKERSRGKGAHPHILQIRRLLRRELDLLTFETFQLFSQVFFIPVFLVFQVFLRGRRRGEESQRLFKKTRFTGLMKTDTPLSHFWAHS